MPLARRVEYIGVDGVPDLSAPSCLYLYVLLINWGKNSFLSLVQFFQLCYSCYQLLVGSSSVLVAGTLAKGPRWSGNPWYQVRVVVNNVDAVSRLELPSFTSHMTGSEVGGLW